MNIAKYNIAPGSGSNASAGATAVSGGAGGGVAIDLTPITDKVAALESRVSQLELQLGKANAVLASLDSRFLSKFGDRSEYSYALGALYTDFIQSDMYDNGVGFRVSGTATAAVEDKYNLIVKDLGWAMVPFNTVQQSDVTIVNTPIGEDTAQLNVLNVSIGPAIASGYLLIDCGATLTNERCFTTISKSVMYKVDRTVGNQVITTGFREADTDSSGRFILQFGYADNVSFSIRFKYTYSFRQVGDITSGTYRLYIRGTDPANNRTDCFAAAIKVSTLNASGLTVMNGTNGARITSSGLETTTDGGTTWT